jgi:tetratricopeptide (TPR) repeat protein
VGYLSSIKADFGICDQVKKDTAAVLSGPSRDGLIHAMWALATCGETGKADSVAADLNKKYPLNSFVQKSDIPQIRARVELHKGNGNKAVEALSPAEAYEFGYVESGVPAYLRGWAYMQMKQGPKAVAEFQKMLDHRAALGFTPYISLARLGLARALALSGDSAKARTAYQDFFTAWKDGDSDIPILKQATMEYARLN